MSAILAYGDSDLNRSFFQNPPIL